MINTRFPFNPAVFDETLASLKELGDVVKAIIAA